MPCVDNYTDHYISSNISKKEISEYDYKIKVSEIKHLGELTKNLTDKVHSLDACICAIFTELEKREILKEIIDIASINGKIDLSKYWENHKIKDEVRLKTDLEKYSKHEIEVIKKILNK